MRTVEEVKQIAQDYLDLYLNHLDLYTIEIADTRTALGKVRPKGLGLCAYGHQTIVIDIDHALYCPIDLVIDTILHEIAHARALVLHGEAGHGSGWKKECKEIGANPKAKSKWSRLSNQYKKVFCSKYKWAICYKNNDGTIGNAGYCIRRTDMTYKWAKGKRWTLGKLFYMPINEYHQLNPDNL